MRWFTVLVLLVIASLSVIMAIRQVFILIKYEKEERSRRETSGYLSPVALSREWTPVEFCCPPKEEEFLMYEGGHDIKIAWMDGTSAYFVADNRRIIKANPTHWMPLPRKPQ